MILRQIAQLAHLSLIAFLALWMGLFAPMICKYHGLMWGLTAHQHHDHDAHSDQMRSQMPALQSGIAKHTPETTSTIMSAFVAALPAAITLEPVFELVSAVDQHVSFPEVVDLRVVEQPPRGCLSV
ncbi:MAG: hypothetical protein KF726_03845 [Anaerolineae bacterium]|nr:hypothetical protein [Anaerolineae bacterium]